MATLTRNSLLFVLETDWTVAKHKLRMASMLPATRAQLMWGVTESENHLAKLALDALIRTGRVGAVGYSSGGDEILGEVDAANGEAV